MNNNQDKNTAKQSDGITVNDGKGLYDNIGLIDTLTVDCSKLMKALVSGQYIEFSATIVGMVQKLGSLRNGVKSYDEALQKQIDEYRQMIEEINKREGD